MTDSPLTNGEYIDFTHKLYKPTRTPKGVPYDPFVSPQKAASILLKCARKSKGGKTKPGTRTVIAHGKK